MVMNYSLEFLGGEVISRTTASITSLIELILQALSHIFVFFGQLLYEPPQVQAYLFNGNSHLSYGLIKVGLNYIS